MTTNYNTTVFTFGNSTLMEAAMGARSAVTITSDMVLHAPAQELSLSRLNQLFGSVRTRKLGLPLPMDEAVRNAAQTLWEGLEKSPGSWLEKLPQLFQLEICLLGQQLSFIEQLEDKTLVVHLNLFPVEGRSLLIHVTDEHGLAESVGMEAVLLDMEKPEADCVTPLDLSRLAEDFGEGFPIVTMAAVAEYAQMVLHAPAPQPEEAEPLPQPEECPSPQPREEPETAPETPAEPKDWWED